MGDLLNKYRRMRDFGETPEPAGGKPKKGKLPIFVIQKHHASHLHYDFRLEMEGVLKSWAIPKGPSYDPSIKRLAMMTEDHPYDYASFEGVIPEGQYGGGKVIIWDQGSWEFIEPGDDPVKALKAGKLTFKLYGKKMFGEWALVRIHGHGKSDRGNEWLLLKHRDGFASDSVDVTEVAPLSVVSGRDVEELGSGDRAWQSNRTAPLSGKEIPTIASKLQAKRAPARKESAAKGSTAKKGTGKAAAKKPAAASRAPAAKKAPGMNKAATATKKKRSAPAAKRAPTRPPAKPSRGASAPTRSSRAGSRP
ncbi:MAG: ATP-dependent ligase clustered with Ku protein, LigD, partial [Acidobacteria bacterium]|nr:ATP-dependent ligase clustered with Ku protein, LigD [Acidobacteriota bacterium]